MPMQLQLTSLAWELTRLLKRLEKNVAEIIGAETNEIIFTGSATEAINLAIKGVAEKYVNRGKHIVTVSTKLVQFWILACI